MRTIKNNRFLYFTALASPYILLFAVLFFRFKGLFVGDKILYYGDIETFFMPVKIFIARSITAGKIPLWSQNLFNGYPFFADPQNGTYYFLNIILDYLIPNILIVNYIFVISIFLISVFSYLFSRAIGLGKIPSIVAALLFSYSYMILNFSYSFIAVYWFIPAIFLFFEKYLRNNKDSKYVLISGLLFGFQILAGSPQISFITMVGLIIYVFFRLFLPIGKKADGLFNTLLHFLKYIGLTVFIGLLISMVQVIPTFVESLKSNVANVSRNFVLQSSLEPIKLFKNLIGVHNNFFFGILTPIFLILIILSLKFKNKHDYKDVFNALSLFILIAILIAFGRYFPLYEYFLIHLPFFDKFPLPQRFAILGVFGISMLAGISLNIILNVIKSRSLLLSSILGFIVLSIVVLNLFAISSQFDITTKYKDIRKSFHLNNFLSADLENSNGRIYPVTGIFPFRIHISASWNPYVLNNSLVAQTPLYYKNLDSITGTKVFILKDYRRIVDTARGEGFSSKLYDLLNLKYIITGKPIPKNVKNVILIRHYNIKIGRENFYLYKLKKTFDRSFLVKKVIFLKNNSAIFKRIINRSFNPENTAYVLHDHSAIKYNECNGTVLIKKWDNNIIDIKTIVNNDCFLFISNTFFNGWKAYINGKQQKIYKTDYNFQGVFIRKGHNKVRLIFEPLYFYIAELISLICLGEVILLLIYLHVNKLYSQLK